MYGARRRRVCHRGVAAEVLEQLSTKLCCATHGQQPFAVQSPSILKRYLETTLLPLARIPRLQEALDDALGEALEESLKPRLARIVSLRRMLLDTVRVSRVRTRESPKIAPPAFSSLP